MMWERQVVPLSLPAGNSDPSSRAAVRNGTNGRNLYDAVADCTLRGTGEHCLRGLSVTGLSEAETEQRIMDLVKNQTNPTIALYVRPGYIAVRLTAKEEIR